MNIFLSYNRLTSTKDNHSQLLQYTTAMPTEFNTDTQNKGMSICKFTKIKTVRQDNCTCLVAWIKLYCSYS
jgi:hypothetical protein